MHFNYLLAAISVATKVCALESILTVLMLLAAAALDVLRKGCVTSETGFEAGSLRPPLLGFLFFFFSFQLARHGKIFIIIINFPSYFSFFFFYST